MKKYFENDVVTLWQGDCREIEIPCDLIVTDPPYGMEYRSNRGQNFKMLAMDDDLAGVHDCIGHVVKSLKNNRHVYIFGNQFDFTSLPLAGITELIWDKGMIGTGNLSLPWGPQHEKITFAVYVPSKANRERGDGALAARLRKGSVIRSNRPNSRGVKYHPTEKPIDVLQQLIESSSVIGDCVYDPFAGSGSTLIAAMAEGRRAIGVEIEEKYCEVAAKRIESTAAELRIMRYGMNLGEKDKYIEEHLMSLSAETLRFMVADNAAEIEQLRAQLAGCGSLSQSR